MKRTIFALALVAMLAACGGGGDDEPVDDPNDPTPAELLLANQASLRVDIDRMESGPARDALIAEYNTNLPLLSAYGAELACKDKEGYWPAYEDCRTLWRSLVLPIPGV